MNEETTTTNLQISSFMVPMYPIIVPAAIAAMTASLVTLDGRRDQHGNQVYLPVSNAPDQPHEHNEIMSRSEPPLPNGAPQERTPARHS